MNTLPQASTRVTSSESGGDFAEILALIESARKRAFASVNHELVSLYWKVGRYISEKLASAVWGEAVIEQLATHIAYSYPDMTGFNRRNLFRMRQFYDVYQGDEKVTPLVTQLPWTHNLLILSRAKHSQEREFYLKMALRWQNHSSKLRVRGAM